MKQIADSLMNANVSIALGSLHERSVAWCLLQYSVLAVCHLRLATYCVPRAYVWLRSNCLICDLLRKRRASLLVAHTITRSIQMGTLCSSPYLVS